MSATPRRMTIPPKQATSPSAAAFLTGNGSRAEPDKAASPSQPPEAPQPKPEGVPEPSPKKSARTSLSAPPWEEADDTRTQMQLGLTRKTKAQLDFIREQTRIPSQAWIRDHLEEIVEQEAKKLWKARK